MSLSKHVYVHVPFCTRRCSYCDFAIAVRKTVPVRDYVRGISRELESRDIPQHEVHTIYLGGGTPSRLGGAGVGQLLDVVRQVCVPTADAEITIEVNPEDVTPTDAQKWAAAGVNRISLGVQSFHDTVLAWMHRVHDASAAARAMHVLRNAGFSDVSVDLIFAVPEELERNWALDIERALALEPTHVSLYGLTIESQTPLGRWTAAGTVREAPEDVYEHEFLHAHAAFTAAGFEHYEVSNYGLPRHRARHNSAYWTGASYLGLGPSAHGYDGTERRWNIAPYAQWQSSVDFGADPIAGAERLSGENRIAESVYLGLRTTDGLEISEEERAVVRAWQAAGWVTLSDSGVLRCTASGWLRLDSIAATLTAHRSP